MTQVFVTALAFGLAASGASAEDGVALAFLRNTVGFSDAQIASVEAGQVVTKQLPSADKPEIAAFGAVCVAAITPLSFAYWWKDKFAPKPTISVFHVTTWTDPERAVSVVASKRIYASHYFQAGLDLLAVVGAPGGGIYLMDLCRVRIDPPTGMLSGVLLGKIRGGIERGVADGLRAQAALQGK